MNENKITQNQYIFIVISGMIGVGILSMASGISKTAQQSGWIATLFGGLYPLFVLLTASIIDNKTNHVSFSDVNKIIYGKVLSSVFIFVFCSYYFLIYISIIAGFANVLRHIIVSFLPPIYIVLPILILIPLITMVGIHMVGRICEFYFYLTIPLIIIPLFFITKGSLINIKPIISSADGVLKAIPASFYAYGGCEISYFIISKVTNRRSTKKAGIIASVVTISIYTFCVFVTIYYLGWELTSKLQYPLLYMIQSLPIPIISNFTALFILLWSVIILKTLVVDCHGVSYLLSALLKIDYKKANFVFLPIALFSVFLFIPEYNRRALLDAIYSYFVIFSFSWGLVTTILVLIKFRGGRK